MQITVLRRRTPFTPGLTAYDVTALSQGRAVAVEIPPGTYAAHILPHPASAEQFVAIKVEGRMLGKFKVEWEKHEANREVSFDEFAEKNT